MFLTFIEGSMEVELMVTKCDDDDDDDRVNIGQSVLEDKMAEFCNYQETITAFTQAGLVKASGFFPKTLSSNMNVAFEDAWEACNWKWKESERK